MKYIEYDNKKIPVKFDLNVISEIQEKYDSFDNWSKRLIVNGQPQIKIIVDTMALMINEGLDIEACNTGGSYKPITPREAGRIIDAVGIENALTIVFDEINAGKSPND